MHNLRGIKHKILFNSLTGHSAGMYTDSVSANDILFLREHGIQIEKIRLYETPNCWVESDSFLSYSKECNVFLSTWRNMKGDMSYDIREK